MDVNTLKTFCLGDNLSPKQFEQLSHISDIRALCVKYISLNVPEIEHRDMMYDCDLALERFRNYKRDLNSAPISSATSLTFLETILPVAVELDCEAVVRGRIHCALYCFLYQDYERPELDDFCARLLQTLEERVGKIDRVKVKHSSLLGHSLRISLTLGDNKQAIVEFRFCSRLLNADFCEFARAF